jgi:hypothetical protein
VPAVNASAALAATPVMVDVPGHVRLGFWYVDHVLLVGPMLVPAA